jgi:integrase/recombinase XerD
LEKADALLAAARADDERRRRSLLGPFVSLLVGTGCRVSEATGLLWGIEGLNLAADPPVMHIRRETTKTVAGVRTVPLDEVTARALREHRLAMGRPGDRMPVFTRPGGLAINRSGRVRSGLARVAASARLDGVSPHVLRHTHATWLAAAGVPAPIAAARLGHADGGALFMRVYAHSGASDGEMALAALAE